MGRFSLAQPKNMQHKDLLIRSDRTRTQRWQLKKRREDTIRPADVVKITMTTREIVEATEKNTAEAMRAVIAEAMEEAMVEAFAGMGQGNEEDCNTAQRSMGALVSTQSSSSCSNAAGSASVPSATGSMQWLSTKSVE